MAFQMFASIALGWFGGNYIDKKIGLTIPIFGIALVILFFAAYFYKLIRDLEKGD